MIGKRIVILIIIMIISGCATTGIDSRLGRMETIPDKTLSIYIQTKTADRKTDSTFVEALKAISTPVTTITSSVIGLFAPITDGIGTLFKGIGFSIPIDTNSDDQLIIQHIVIPVPVDGITVTTRTTAELTGKIKQIIRIGDK